MSSNWYLAVFHTFDEIKIKSNEKYFKSFRSNFFNSRNNCKS